MPKFDTIRLWWPIMFPTSIPTLVYYAYLADSNFKVLFAIWFLNVVLCGGASGICVCNVCKTLFWTLPHKASSAGRTGHPISGTEKQYYVGCISWMEESINTKRSQRSI